MVRLTRMAWLAAALLASTAGAAQPRQPDSSFVIYFESDSSTLNGVAREVLDTISGNALRHGAREWLLEGHDDTAAPAEVSMEMSRRRAEAVRDHLVGRGVPPSSIRVTSHGEGQLARPTYDGVREPLNRRVEINVRY